MIDTLIRCPRGLNEIKLTESLAALPEQRDEAA
jgi:hypothetical protein